MFGKAAWLGATAAIALLFAAGSASASNLDKLKQFKLTGSSLDIETVDQDTDYAAQLRKNLEMINMPPGFKIDLYAVVPDARHMAVGPSTGMVFVGTRKTRVWAVTDRNKDRVADEVKVFAPPVDFKVPNGVCFSRDGFLYVAEHNRILNFPAAEFFYESPDVAVIVTVDQGELIPVEEESFNHGARVCRIGPDDQLYVALGQPFNVPPKEKMALYDETGIGGIVRMNRWDGSDREVYTLGVRNSVGIDFNPANGELWWTDNQVDGMGDDIPPGEINRQTAAGQHFGFPYYGGGLVRTVEYQDETPPADAVPPVVETVAHAADLGLTFYTGRQFPEQYKGGIFSAQHGSWNRTTPIGARVMFTAVKDDGSVGDTKVFADGWLLDTGEYMGRPVDVAQLPDGSILVSDDFAGAIYRISYEAPE